MDSRLHEEAAGRRHNKEPNLCASPNQCSLVEQGTAALQEIHIEMELEITVDLDWISSHWVSSSAANEPPRRIKLFPGLLGSWIWVVEE